jgi:hypothetical protein
MVKTFSIKKGVQPPFLLTALACCVVDLAVIHFNPWPGCEITDERISSLYEVIVITIGRS